MNKIGVFKKFLDTFETDELREYCKDMIEKMHDYIFTIPASTSFKWHNKTQCQPGGQLYHILMACEIMNYILGLEYIQEKWNKPKQRDCFRVAICLHDAVKCGNQLSEPLYTLHEHPVWCADWIKETTVEHDINDKLKEYISSLVASHSGQWVSSNKSIVILPKPQDDEHFLIHLCDYLGSRNNIDMIYDDEITNSIQSCQTLPDIETYELGFGKHKGLTLKQIQKIDPEYIRWAKENLTREPVKSLLKELQYD